MLRLGSRHGSVGSAGGRSRRDQRESSRSFDPARVSGLRALRSEVGGSNMLAAAYLASLRGFVT